MSNCNTIKTQIEEAALGEYGQAVSVHLLQCDACRNFEKEQRSLRELVGSLGTVQAPADFDFKLRARMANASGRPGGVRLILSPVVASATILLLVGIIAGITYINKRPSTETASQNTPKSNPVEIAPSSSPEQKVAVNPVEKPKSERSSVGTMKVKLNSGSANQIAYRPRRQMSVADSSSTGATTVGMSTQLKSTGIFPIDASLNSVKVSLDDSRGNARTISLPGISFGSQRLVGNQLNQKGVW